ncbi:methionyl-tRNA formyltransferase [Candidatus Riflebacteria bacterium]
MQEIKKIIFFGHNQWAVLTLDALLKNNYDVPLVVTETDAFNKKEKKNYTNFARFGAYGDLKVFALERGLKVLQPQDANAPEFVQKLKNHSPDLIVCVSYHTIFQKPFLRAFKGKIINAHIAPLPFYRGRAPLNWAIINGERRHGLTVHIVDKGIDTGPIIHQEFCDINEDDRAIDLLLHMLPLFPKAVLKSIKKINEDYPGVPQNPLEGSYFPRRYPEDGLIDFGREKTMDIFNKVRALAFPYPGAYVTYKKKMIKINKCRYQVKERPSPVPGLVYKRSERGFWVTTLDGSLEVLEIIEQDKVIRGATLAYYLKPGTGLLLKRY